jgi:type II secretion system (T2SS) protein E
VHRIGELLRAEGLLTIEQLEEALRAQADWGGRLGTILIELGFIDLDGLSRALGRQHDLPAAVAQHFDAADEELQRRLPAELAARFHCLPLYRIESEQVVVVGAEPLDEPAFDAVARALDIDRDQIFPAVAAELRVRYQLDRIYRVAIAPHAPRASRRRRRSPGSDTLVDMPPPPLAAAPPPRELPEPVHPSFIARGTRRDVQVARIAIEPRRDSAALLAGSESRLAIARGTRNLSDGVPGPLPVDESHRMPAPQPPAPVRAPAKRKPSGTDARALLGGTLGEATRTIRRAADRTAILEHTLATLEHFVPAVDAALLLLVTGERVVCAGWFTRDGRPLPGMAIPVDAPGLVPAVIRRNAPLRGTASELGVLDTLLLETCGRPDGELLAIPLAAGDRALGALALAIERDALVDGVDSIAAATGAALGRLERNAPR